MDMQDFWLEISSIQVHCQAVSSNLWHTEVIERISVQNPLQSTIQLYTVYNLNVNKQYILHIIYLQQQTKYWPLSRPELPDFCINSSSLLTAAHELLLYWHMPRLKTQHWWITLVVYRERCTWHGATHSLTAAEHRSATMTAAVIASTGTHNIFTASISYLTSRPAAGRRRRTRALLWSRLWPNLRRLYRPDGGWTESKTHRG